MSSYAWLQIIWAVGALVLLLGAYRSHNIGAKRTLVMALVWAGLFLLVGLLASLIIGTETVDGGIPASSIV